MSIDENENLWRQASASLNAVGTRDFQKRFLTLVRALGADQCMIFSYNEGYANCLLARSYVEGKVGQKLAETYLNGWFRKDPLYKDVMTLPSGACRLRKMKDIVGAMSQEYFEMFFERPALSDKVSVLATGSKSRLAVNIYNRHSGSARLFSAQGISEPLFLMMGKMALLHFESAEPPDYPLPLSVLSKRERDVCLGILKGKKAEIIAADMKIAPNSVVTYRRRAYAKLGVNSRAGLFALCSN